MKDFMVIKLYDTLSGEKKALPKPGKKPLKLFVCGPTVYDYSHIGHGRTYIFFDIFTRYLKSLGYKVFYLQNITDIDDKIIARAKEKNLPPQKLAKKLIKSHLEDMKALGITSVTKYARATQFIPEIVRQVQALIKKGYAYKIPGDGYYFDISKFKDYGKLSRRTAAQAEDAVSRIDDSVRKKNRGDFCLWKFPHSADLRRLNADQRRRKFTIANGEPVWATPLGWGRPGWHIEDTAISEKFFGPQYEIHGGGLDLKFPHHEAEIAQAEAASGKKPFVKIWMHGGLLTVNGEKMSKSLGNFITIRDFLKIRSANILRLIVASHHYRLPIDYTEELARDAQNALSGINEFLAKVELIKSSKFKVQSSKLQFKIKKYEREFKNAMADDINTPRAMAAVFNLINGANKVIWDLSKTQAESIKKWLSEKLNIFGINAKIPKIPLKIKALINRRELLRSNKQFVQADTLRKKIEGLGYVIEDTPRGPLVLKKN